MQPPYDPTGHPELSAEARALSQERLDSLAERAVEVLGLAGTEHTGRAAERLTLAVVLQLNRTLRLEGRADVVQESKGDQSVTYAKPKEGDAAVIDPEAARIVAAVLSEQAPGVMPITSRVTPNIFVW